MKKWLSAFACGLLISASVCKSQAEETEADKEIEEAFADFQPEVTQIK